MFEGSVDEVTTTKATGWLYDRVVGRAADVVALLHGHMIGEAPASIHRPDLEEVGFGDGRCGFDLPFYEPVRDPDLPFVVVQPKGSNLLIPRTTYDSYKDLIAQTMRLYPGTGRSRTVLGGLWIDRTDALQILAGRVKVGSCDNALFPALRALIADGWVEMPLEAGDVPAEVADRISDPFGQGTELSDAATVLWSHLLTADIAGLFKAAFDDVPAVYRPGILAGEQTNLAQVPSFEVLTSPAEVLAGYVLSRGEGRLDYVFDSHELPEFAPSGTSRWAPESETVAPVIAEGSQRPIRSMDLSASRLTLVGPGLIHRIVVPSDASVLRVIATPQRVTPLRFLAEGAVWENLAFANGVRGRF